MSKIIEIFFYIKHQICLTNFLSEPFDSKKTAWYKKTGKDVRFDDIKTNWQWLILEYNDNTGCNYEELPLDLPQPDFMQLAKEVESCKN